MYNCCDHCFDDCDDCWEGCCEDECCKSYRADTHDPSWTPMMSLTYMDYKFATRDQSLYMYDQEFGRYAPGVALLRRCLTTSLLERWTSAKADMAVKWATDNAPETWDTPPLDRLNVLNGIPGCRLWQARTTLSRLPVSHPDQRRLEPGCRVPRHRPLHPAGIPGRCRRTLLPTRRTLRPAGHPSAEGRHASRFRLQRQERHPSAPSGSSLVLRTSHPCPCMNSPRTGSPPPNCKASSSTSHPICQTGH